MTIFKPFSLSIEMKEMFTASNAKMKARCKTRYGILSSYFNTLFGKF